MNIYIQVLEVKPREGSIDTHRFTKAVVRLYARADSEQGAVKLMSDHLDEMEWEILEVHKSGMLHPGQNPYSDAVCKWLETHDVCADVHHTPPPEGTAFSKS